MDLSTKYLGLKLKNPLVASSSPLSGKVEDVKKLEDAGVAAVVVYSLFEEQITHETYELHHHMTQGTESFAESLSYFPEPEDFVRGPDQYLEHIRKIKSAVKIPIIASLNGHSAGGWVDYAKKMQDAGADAIELNVYYLPTDPTVPGHHIEQAYLDIVKAVKGTVKIPVAVKLSPFFSSMANMAKRLDDVGADGLVLFNRFYQPDIDLEKLEVVPNVMLSTRFANRLPLRWVAILYGQIKASLAATSGVHEHFDVIKMVMAGADVAMVCSSLLKNGIPHASHILENMKAWMEEHEYDSVQQMKGSMSHKAVENPAAFERANYMKALQSYKA